MVNHRQEEAIFWRDVALDNLELLRATFITHAFKPHTHEGFAIGVIMAGAEQFEYRRRTHVAPAGTMIVINPGEVHTGEAAGADGWRYRMIYPAASTLQQAGAQATGRTQGVPFFSEVVIRDPVTVQLFLQMHRYLELSTSQLARESWLMWGLGWLVLRHADGPRPSTRLARERACVAQVRAYLESQYSENVTLDQLAALVHFSPFHLLRVFKQETGLSPHAYLIDVRVKRAKALLRAGLSPAQAAQQVGFVDQSHLSRHFKRIVGVPPGKYVQGGG